MDQLADIDALSARLATSPRLRGREVVRLAPADPPPVDLAAELDEALARPIGTAPLRALARGCRRVAIITSDATRATPSAALIGPVMRELAHAGVTPDAVDVVIGVGAHRPATADEIRVLLGADWAARLTVTNHDARSDDLVSLGSTTRGTPLLVNRHVAQADLRIAFGQVEPHEFAGFTGGRKAILPSVAGYESIVRNHALSMLVVPTARPGILEGNPIHEEMLEAARLARLDFIVNVALDRESRPIAVAAGDVERAHEELVTFLRRTFGVTRPARPPAVIVTGVGEPLDVNLYQAVKALVGIEPLLDDRPAGAPAPVVVLLARCWDGAGSDAMFECHQRIREQLAEVAARGEPSADALSVAVLDCLPSRFTIEMDEAYFVARVTPKCSAVIAVCPGVPVDRLRLLGWETAADADAALARALELSDEIGRAGRAARDDEAAGLVAMCPRAQRALFV